MTATDLPGGALLADAGAVLARAPQLTPEDRFEAAAWAALLDRHGPALLTRACAPSHLTASAIVLDPDGRHTCLVLHGRIGLWVQPGGHLEAEDAGMAAAAAREAVEETGLAGTVLPDPVLLSRHRAPCRPGVVDWHLDVQFALVTGRTDPVVSEESKDVRWWPVDGPDGLDGLAADGMLALGVDESVRRARQALG